MPVFRQMNPSQCNILLAFLYQIKTLASLVFYFKRVAFRVHEPLALIFNPLWKPLKMFSLCSHIFCSLTWLDTDTKNQHLPVLQKAKYSFPLTSPITVLTANRVHSRMHLKEAVHEKIQQTCCLILPLEINGESL